LNQLLEIDDRRFLQWLKEQWGICFKQVRQDFDLQGSPERSLSRAVIETVSGDLFLLEKFSSEKFIVRKRVSRTIDHLNRHGLDQALGGKRTRQGEFLPFFKGNCFQLSPFLDSTGLARPDWLGAAEIGNNMALFLIQMHRASRGLPDQLLLPSFSIKDYIFKLFAQMREHEPRMADRYSPFLDFLGTHFMGAHDRLPQIFCHGDFHPLNVLWDRYRIRAVIDWEFTGLKPDCYDAANLVGCAGIENPEGLGMPMVTTFLGKIRSAGIISPIGWQYFPEYVLALRFAWLSEWLRKKDSEMLALEAAFMGVLIRHMEELRSIWDCLPPPKKG
jgi:homoserine kinase type II